MFMFCAVMGTVCIAWPGFSADTNADVIKNAGREGINWHTGRNKEV